MFHRIGKAAYKADLKNIFSLCDFLGNPQREFKSIHVAGTNGKGSTSHLIASVLQECKYKTGLFTSPHLKDFRERIRINGLMIPENYVIDFVSRIKEQIEVVKPSFFEMTTALAFDFFAKEKVEVAVMEVGMGGRLDSTNVITPVASVITNIGLDHTQFLGDTLENIAFEKAGIIKPYVPIIIGETHKATEKVFREKAKKENAEIFFADQSITINPYQTPLNGFYQRKNTKTVLQSLSVLKQLGFQITGEKVGRGFLNVIKNTGLMGRWQVLAEKPLIICDVAHNIDGINEIINQINVTPHKKLHFVLGMVNDKDHDSVLSLLPQNAIYYFCKPAIPRGLGEKELLQLAGKHRLKGQSYASVKEAFYGAQSRAEAEDLIFVGGSTFVVAEVL